MPEVDAIVARLLDYREGDFEIGVAEAGGGEIDITIDGCRDLDLGDMLRLEGIFQALGPHAREGVDVPAPS